MISWRHMFGTMGLLGLLSLSLVSCFGGGQGEQQKESLDTSQKGEAEVPDDEAQGSKDGEDNAMNNGENGGLDEVINQLKDEAHPNGVAAVPPPPPPAAPDAGGATEIPILPQHSSPGMVAGLAGKAAAPGLPEMGSKIPYVVHKGDTLSKISHRIYGNYKHWEDMAKVSGLANPNLIYPGDVVYYQLTDKTLAFAKKHENQPMQEVKVKKGDTLAGISLKLYGKKDYWKRLWRNNGHIANPDALEVGMVIYADSLASLTTNHDAHHLRVRGAMQAPVKRMTKQHV